MLDLLSFPVEQTLGRVLSFYTKTREAELFLEHFSNRSVATFCGYMLASLLLWSDWGMVYRLIMCLG